jgi:hypothetical protein
MTEEIAQQIATHQAALEKLLSDLPAPDLVTVSDRDGNHLNGNQAGYLQLAIECLSSAQGRSVGLWNKFGCAPTCGILQDFRSILLQEAGGARTVPIVLRDVLRLFSQSSHCYSLGCSLLDNRCTTGL